MGISEIRAKSNQFVSSIIDHVEDAVNDVSKDITQMNKDQMLDSLQPSGKPIFPYYSDRYAKRKGFPYPNLYDKGDFQNDMFLLAQGEEFFISSADEKNPMLVERYEAGSNKIFGVPENKIDKARSIALSSLARVYNKFVLNG